MRSDDLWWLVLAGVAAAALFAGCGDDTEKPVASAGQGGTGIAGEGGTAGAPGGSSGSGGSTGGHGGTAGGGGEAGNGGAAGSGPVIPLQLTVFEYSGSTEYRAEADFKNFTSERCEAVQVGTCTFRDCRDDGTPITGVSAGTITLAGGSGSGVVMSPNAAGAYDYFLSKSSRWETGDVISASAAGATVPAFTEQLMFPDPVQIPTTTTMFVMDQNAPYEVEWVPTDEEVSIFLVQWYGSGGNRIYGTCEYPGADGTGTIPVELLAMFQPGPDAPTAGILIAHKSAVNTTAGPYPLEFQGLHGQIVWTAFLDKPLGGTSAASKQLEAVVLSPAGPADLQVEDVLVTYVKPDGLGDVGGFFVQADPVGPAVFVATAPPYPAVGDRVSFHVTEMGISRGAPRILGLTGLTTSETGQDVESLRQDVTDATELVSNVAHYASELIHIEATIAGPWEAGGAGHMRVPLTSSGISSTAPSGTGGLWLRLPVPTFDITPMIQGCTVTVDAHLWRFDLDAQVSSYTPSEVVVSCP